MKKTFLSLSWLLCLVFFIQCEEEPKPVHTDPAELNQTDLLTLASITQEDGVKIEFLELNPGDVVVSTVYSMDSEVSDPIEQINELIRGGKSYTHIYKTLAGNATDNSMIRALEFADQRVKASRLNHANEGFETTRNWDVPLENLSTVVNGRTATSCPDVFGDNFSAQWFLDYYGQFPKPVRLPNGQVIHPPMPPGMQVIYGTNNTGWGWGEQMYAKSLYSVNVMAPDFNTGVNVFSIEILRGGSLRTGPPVFVGPRSVRNFSSGAQDGRYIRSVNTLDPCPRLHYSRLKDV